MNEAMVTAVAWIPDEPKMLVSQGQATGFEWRILAEASVTDTDGKPMSGLAKNSWKVHVTDAQGGTLLPAFSVGPMSALPPTVLPGFYLLKVSKFQTGTWIMPTAFGIAISSKKMNLEGQVVVPIALAGPTVVSGLTKPGL
jgi:hypothetical protein